MENFSFGEHFYDDMEDYFLSAFDEDIDEVRKLPDEWEEKVELCELEPSIELDLEKIYEFVFRDNEERFPEQYDDDPIKELFISCFDLEKFKKLVPQLYYPSGNFYTITKQELLDDFDI